MSGRTHIIGAGLAGLMAALELVDRGRDVVIHEASPHVGGRCRSYHDPKIGRVIDNGTHALAGANPVALALLKRLKHRGDWVAPPGETIPLVDLGANRARTIAPPKLDLKALLTRRASDDKDGLARPRARDLIGLTRLLTGRDRPVADLFADTPFYRDVIDPLTLAALNTRSEEASSALLAAVLKATLRGKADVSRETGGAGEAVDHSAPPLAPLIARRGLGPDLVDPLVKAITTAGGRLRFNSRVDALRSDGARVTGLSTNQGSVPLADGDAIILAVPAHLAARLHPPCAVAGMAPSPIVNLHVVLERDPRRGTPLDPHGPDDARRPGEGALNPLMVGVLGGASQWLAYRGDTVSTTVSAADSLATQSAETVFETLWDEMRRASKLMGLDLGERPLAWRVVKERWATLRQTPGLARPPAATSLSNLVLAGDWTDTGLPFTIEGALRSGRTAAMAVSGMMGSESENGSEA